MNIFDIITFGFVALMFLFLTIITLKLLYGNIKNPNEDESMDILLLIFGSIFFTTLTLLYNISFIGHIIKTW